MTQWMSGFESEGRRRWGRRWERTDDEEILRKPLLFSDAFDEL